MVSTHHCGLAQFEKDFNTQMKKKIVGGLASIFTTTPIPLHVSPFTVMIFFTEDTYFAHPAVFCQDKLGAINASASLLSHFLQVNPVARRSLQNWPFSWPPPVFDWIRKRNLRESRKCLCWKWKWTMFDLNFENLALGWACSLSGTSTVAEFAPLLVDKPKDCATTCD